MSLSAGIVGIPNVGKSTLFNTITNSSVEAANYPFATIEPNVGVVKVPDKRLYQLAALVNPAKTTPTLCTFVDIAGLVRGASKGEGLGNQFLSNIREVDMICHVVRCFEDKQITHFYETVDPIRDSEIINLELIISDLEAMEKRYSKVINKAKSGDKETQVEADVCKRIIDTLKQNKFPRLSSFGDKELDYAKSYNLLTTKPVLYICNIDEKDVANPNANAHYTNFKKHIEAIEECTIIPISIAIEYEVSKLSDEDKEIFMSDLGMNESGLDRLINTTYYMLGIQTFFTFGADETKA
jgi:GTP-binding protein YchF